MNPPRGINDLYYGCGKKKQSEYIKVTSNLRTMQPVRCLVKHTHKKNVSRQKEH